MYFLRRVFGSNRISFIGIGVSGAMVSNIAQLALAWFFVFRQNILYIAPPFLAVGLVTGIALGAFCEMFTSRSKFYPVREAEKKEREKGKREEIYQKIFGARALFFTGLIVMPALLFNPSTEIRVIQFLFFWFLVLLSGKKNRPVFTLLVITSIVVFNLIVPYGRVLFSIGAFQITENALKAGIHRAFTFQGLVMLSKVCVRQDLQIPGAFGELLGESLRFFSAMMNEKHRITVKNFFADIDNIILKLSSEDVSVPANQLTRTTPVGFFVLGFVITVSWLLWIKGFL
jgi:heptaprenyl diphosphate synthase